MTEKILTNQINLTTSQSNSLNSGITAAKVSTYDGYASGKQNTLSAAQLAAANSGIDTTKVAQISTNTNNITQKVILRVWS